MRFASTLIAVVAFAAAYVSAVPNPAPVAEPFVAFTIVKDLFLILLLSARPMRPSAAGLAEIASEQVECPGWIQ